MCFIVHFCLNVVNKIRYIIIDSNLQNINNLLIKVVFV